MERPGQVRAPAEQRQISQTGITRIEFPKMRASCGNSFELGHTYVYIALLQQLVLLFQVQGHGPLELKPHRRATSIEWNGTSLPNGDMEM